MDAVQKALRLAKEVGGGMTSPDAQGTSREPNTSGVGSGVGTMPDSMFLNQLYQSQFGRAADQPGLDYWTNQLKSGAITREGVQKSFEQSPERQVRSYYSDILNRAPDQSGLDYWVNQLNTGAITPDLVQKSFVNVANAEKAPALLADIYQTELGRAPDTEGTAYWTNQLATGALTPDQVKQSILASSENQIQDIYQSQLGRNPDQAGLDYWKSALDTGRLSAADIQRSIAASPESTLDDFQAAYKQYLGRDADAEGLKYWQDAVATGRLSLADALNAIAKSQEASQYTAKQATIPGGNKDDTIPGGNKDDTVPGGNKDDTIPGGKKDDTIPGGKKDDTISGGTKTDTFNLNDFFNFRGPIDITKQGAQLVYKAEPYRDYGATAAAFRVASGLEGLPAGFRTLSPTIGGATGGGGTVETITGGGGTDTKGGSSYEDILNDIISGGGKDTTGGGSSTDFTKSLTDFYQSELGRTPDSEGLQYWLNQIASGKLTLDDARKSILASPENQIQDIYQAVLKKNPDQSGLDYWKKALASGNMTIQDIRKSIESSPEATLPAFTKAYQDYLGKTPDAEGLKYWQNAVATGRMTLAEAINAIAKSPEALSRTGMFNAGGAVHGYADGGSSKYGYQDLITAAYRDMLDRAPDEAGMAYWLKDLQSGVTTPERFKEVFQKSGYEDDVVKAYRDILNRSPDQEGREYWTNQLKNKEITMDEFLNALKKSPEGSKIGDPYAEYQKYVYGNVPRSDMFSELQGGRMYDIDIGRPERLPRLEGTGQPSLNVKQAFENSEIARLQKELDAANAAKDSMGRQDTGGGGGNGGGGDGTAGGLGDTAGGGGYGSAPGNADSASGSPAGDGGGTMGGAMARGGNVGNNAINNALRLIKADRR